MNRDWLNPGNHNDKEQKGQMWQKESQLKQKVRPHKKEKKQN